MVDGKPVLMVDSIDLLPEYENSTVRTWAIRKAVFRFLKRYAAAVGIKQVYLGDSGPLVKNRRTGFFEMHFIHNDVPTDDLKIVRCLKIEKLGGYCFNRPYFLESVGGCVVRVISQE